jgi:hypothetical protein
MIGALILVNRDYLLYIVDSVLFHCSSAIDAAANLSIAVNVIGSLQDLTALGIVLLYLTPDTKVARYVIAANMAILVGLFVPFVIIQSIYVFYELEPTYYLYSLTVNLSAAYYFLLLCAAVCGLWLRLLSPPSLGPEDWFWFAPVILSPFQLLFYYSM